MIIGRPREHDANATHLAVLTIGSFGEDGVESKIAHSDTRGPLSIVCTSINDGLVHMSTRIINLGSLTEYQKLEGPQDYDRIKKGPFFSISDLVLTPAFIANADFNVRKLEVVLNPKTGAMYYTSNGNDEPLKCFGTYILASDIRDASLAQAQIIPAEWEGASLITMKKPVYLTPAAHQNFLSATQ